MRGVLLAGGTGTRLWPLTKSVCKQLLPIYDKPLIYYPLYTLMELGIRDVLIICTAEDLESFFELLGDGQQFGISLTYEIQQKPEGIAQALIIASEFLEGHDVCLILGDNLLYGSDLAAMKNFSLGRQGAMIFATPVTNPEDYGVVEISASGEPKSIIEKPQRPISNLAIPGIYFFDSTASSRAKKVTKSDRGEYEIISVINSYLTEGVLDVRVLGKGFAWLDCGSPKSLLDAGLFVRVIEERTGIKIGCIEEIAFRNDWLNSGEIIEKAKSCSNLNYAEYLKNLV